MNGGSDAAVTWGSDYIVSTLSMGRFADEVMPHEFGHIRQARELGLMYLPTYVKGFADIWQAYIFFPGTLKTR